MKPLLLAILSVTLAFGVETKSQRDLPPGALGDEKLMVERVTATPWDSGEVTLRFRIKGVVDGSKISLHGGFPRSKDHPVSISIRITKNDKSVDYKVEQGSEFAKNLAKLISPVTIEKGDDGYNSKEYIESRVKFLQQLLIGTYSWKNPPPF
jgi:hypothetical protein